LVMEAVMAGGKRGGDKLLRKIRSPMWSKIGRGRIPGQTWPNWDREKKKRRRTAFQRNREPDPIGKQGKLVLARKGVTRPERDVKEGKKKKKGKCPGELGISGSRV